MRRKKITACLIENDEYFHRDNEMARPDINDEKEIDIPEFDLSPKS